ncbi:MAG: DUF1080 domain-containing protein [Planctomycetota bacterium]
MTWRHLLLLGALLWLAPLAAAGEDDDTTPYALDYLTPPDGARLEVGGLDFLPDGRLVVSTRRGQVWIVENALANDPSQAEFTLFAEGLREGLGLEIVDGEIYVLQRGELSRLRDVDGDGVCDDIDTITNDWGVSGNYHEFAFGLPRDEEGNFYLSLNVSFFSPKWWHGKSPVPYRGWVLQVTPDGLVHPFASGFRSPCGISTNPAGDVFVTDNQGDWVAACPILHVQEGRFYGHPASLDWTEAYQESGRLSTDTVPPERRRAPAAVWLPYKWSRSTGNIVFDETQGKFGPFEGQAFVSEMTNGLLMRSQMEKVRGEYQGAVFLFKEHIGSATRLRFAPDGSLFIGMTNRGWGGQAPADGLARLRWTGVVPMEMKSVHLLQTGFEVTFTEPIGESGLTPEQVALEQYDFNYWWEYGSPETNITPIEVTEVALSEDRLKATILTGGLKPGMIARVVLSDVRSASGQRLVHDEFDYTINQLPEGPKTDKHVSNLVAPPPTRERWEEGMLMLTRVDPLDAWEGDGWQAGRARFERGEPGAIGFEERGEELVNVGGEGARDLVSKYAFGDVDVHVEFMLPQGGNSGVYLMGRYEVQLLDSSGKEELGFGDCGGIYQGWGDGNAWPGRAPMFNAFRGAGQWHSLDISFEAPRFDEQGRKTANARFLRVKIDDVLLHENIEVPNPTRGAVGNGEVAVGPLRIQGDHGPVAIRNVRVKQRELLEPKNEDDWTRIFDGQTLDGWKTADEGQWTIDDGMIKGEGGRSHLFSPRGDYRNFEARAKVRINDGGNSGFYFRTTFGPGWPAGYEAQVNSSHADPQKTGSLYGIAPVKAGLVPPNTWFDYRVTCRDVENGVHVVIRVNDVVVTDVVDESRRHDKGHIALQQHHQGSVVWYQDIEVRELK